MSLFFLLLIRDKGLNAFCCAPVSDPRNKSNFSYTFQELLAQQWVYSQNHTTKKQYCSPVKYTRRTTWWLKRHLPFKQNILRRFHEGTPKSPARRKCNAPVLGTAAPQSVPFKCTAGEAWRLANYGCYRKQLPSPLISKQHYWHLLSPVSLYSLEAIFKKATVSHSSVTPSTVQSCMRLFHLRSHGLSTENSSCSATGQARENKPSLIYLSLRKINSASLHFLPNSPGILKCFVQIAFHKAYACVCTHAHTHKIHKTITTKRRHIVLIVPEHLVKQSVL